MSNLKEFIQETTLNPKYSTVGWGNGYVAIPPNHKYYGIDYDNIPVDVHGGLTFGQMVKTMNKNQWPNLPENIENWYVIGFDTAHVNDNLSNWPKKRVLKETLKLKEQLSN